MIYYPQVSTVHEGCKSPEIKVASIISVKEIVGTEIMRYFFPSFRPPQLTSKFLLVKNGIYIFLSYCFFTNKSSNCKVRKKKTSMFQFVQHVNSELISWFWNTDVEKYFAILKGLSNDWWHFCLCWLKTRIH